MGGRPFLSLLILFLVTTRAALVNRTIDDTNGDSVTGQVPVYQPASPWGTQTCQGCDIVPDPNLAFDGTWHAATYHPELLNVNITFSFTGVSIWVFFILANANTLGTGITSNTQCNFTLDGQFAGSFNHQPNESTYFLQYNATAFSRSGLSNSQHELVIATNGLPESAFLNFDYAIYSVDAPDSVSESTSGASSTGGITTTSSTTASSTTRSSSHSQSLSAITKLGIIIGCVLGGLILIVLAAVLILFQRLHKKEKSSIPKPISFFSQARERSDRDDLTTSGSHPPWQSSMYTDIPDQRLTSAGTTTFNDQQSHMRPPFSDLSSEVTSLVPVRREDGSKSRDELRAVRQMEINQRLQNAQQEMHDLTSRQSHSGHGPSHSNIERLGTDQQMETMREQIRHLRTQIEQLQVDRSSDWALGLSDHPPPAYN